MVHTGKRKMRKPLENHDPDDNEQQQVESTVKAYKEKIIHTWINLKEDINGISCFEKYFDTQRLKRENFRGLRCRSLSDTNERFLLSVYHLIENTNDITFFETCVSKNVVKMLHNPNKDKLAYKHSDLVAEVNKSELQSLIQKKKGEIKQLLKPKDVGFVKDYFLQSQIIGIDENEQLFEMMEMSKYNAVLEILIDIIIRKLDEGSFECFLSGLKDIVYEQKLNYQVMMVNQRTYNMISQTVLKQTDVLTQFQKRKSSTDTDYETNPVQTVQNRIRYKTSLQSVEIHAALQDTNGTDMSATHERLKENQACLNKSLLPNCGHTVSKTDNGSVIIQTRSLGMFVEEKLGKCLLSGEFATVIEMLFNDVDLADSLPPGKYTLNVTVRSSDQTESNEFFSSEGMKVVTKYRTPNMTVPKNPRNHRTRKPRTKNEVTTAMVLTWHRQFYENDCQKDTRPLDALGDNMNFLVDEMDTEIIVKGFKRHNVTIFEFDSNIERKTFAHHMMTHVIGKPGFKETFLQILQEEQLEYMLNRLNTYEEIYKSDRNHLQKNMFVMFPVLAEKVDLDDVKTTFVERNVLDESIFNEMENKHESRRDLGMASLLVKILTSADIALPTFVDALHKSYLQSIARTIIDREPHIDISKRIGEFAIEMVEKTTGNILFEGSFELTIKCKVDEKEDRMRWRFPLGFLKHKDFSDKRTTTPLTKPTLKSEVGEKEDRMRKILPRKIFEHKDFSDKGTTTTSTEPTLKSEVEEKEDRMRWRLAGTNFELEEREDMMSRILRRGILEHRGTTTASTEPTLKFEEDVRQPPIARPPSPVDKSLSDDVKAWKKIRSETIPRLERLERELRSANENIKTARTVRNWTIGLSLFGSFLLAPFTGGGSFAAAAAISGGTTGVLYIIEMCIEKDVLKTTQEGINRDKAETIRLRTRITSYQGGHKRTEEFVHDLGGIALDAIFQLSQNPLLAFIVSFVDNNSMSLLKAVDQVISLRIQLDRELRRVEEVEGRFY